jgi:hypothetical protein
MVGDTDSQFAEYSEIVRSDFGIEVYKLCGKHWHAVNRQALEIEVQIRNS